MATAFKSLDTRIPFTPAPKPNIRVVWSQGAAAQAVGAALAHQPIAEATLEELAIADLTRGVVATARQLLSPRMYAAFLRWGEAASRLATHLDGDDEGIRRCGAHTSSVHAVSDVATDNEHDLAFKRYLLAIEITESSPLGPVRTDQDACTTGCGDALVRGLGSDIVPQSAILLELEAMATRAWDWSKGTAAWTTEIGGAITAVVTEALRSLENAGENAGEGEGSDIRPLDMSAYDRWMRGPLIAWNRQYDRYVAAADELAAYDRDVHTPTFDGTAASDEMRRAVQARYDELCSTVFDETDRLWRLPAPGPAELATKLKLYHDREGYNLVEADAYVRQLAIDARRFGRHGAHVQTDERLLRAFTARRREHEANHPANMSAEAEDAFFARVDAVEEVILDTRASTIEGVLAKLRVGFASRTLEGWSEAANGDVTVPQFRDGLRMAGFYERMIWSGIEDLARIGGVNLSEQGR